jgi:hypothetical protein
MAASKSIGAWIIVGLTFGELFAIIATTEACAPRGLWKPQLALWLILLPVEYAVIGAIVGLIVYFVARRSFLKQLNFGWSLSISGACAVVVLIIFVLGIGMSAPSDSCAVP